MDLILALIIGVIALGLYHGVVIAVVVMIPYFVGLGVFAVVVLIAYALLSTRHNKSD